MMGKQICSFSSVCRIVRDRYVLEIYFLEKIIQKETLYLGKWEGGNASYIWQSMFK